MKTALCAALTLLCFAAGCSTKTIVSTQVMARIDAAPAVSASTHVVHVLVRSGQGEATKWEDRYDKDLETTSASAWPLEVSLTPKNGDATRVYEVVATALDTAGKEIARVRAISGFRANKALTLALRFDDACLGKVDVCNDMQTCRDGDCKDAHVAASLLPAYDPKDVELLNPNGSDAGADRDAADTATSGHDSRAWTSDGGGTGNAGTTGSTDASVVHCGKNESACGDKCFDLRSDPEHCGACDVACRAAPGDTPTCSASKCPVVLAPLTSLTRAATAMAIDGTDLYWGTSYTQSAGLGMTINVGEVQKVPLDGGLPTTIATMTPVVSLALDGDSMYLANLGMTTSGIGGGASVYRLSTGGGALTPMGGGGSVVTADNGTAYWLYSGYVYRRGPSDSAAVMLNTSVIAGTPSPVGIAVRGKFVYFLIYDGTGTVYKVATGGGVASTVGTAPMNGVLHGIALDATNVYWTATGSTGSDGCVMKVALAGGTPVAIATAQANPWAVAADGKNVYWLNYGGGGTMKNGAVMKLAVDGGTPVELAPQRDIPTNIAVDDTAVYWVERNAVMMRSPK